MSQENMQGGAASAERDEGQQHHLRDRAQEQAHRAAHAARHMAQDAGRHYVREPASDLVGLMRDYARERPDVAAIWCFALGVVVGWKLRP